MDPITAFGVVTGVLGVLGVSTKDLVMWLASNKTQPVSVAFERTISLHSKMFPEIKQQFAAFLASEAMKTALDRQTVGASTDWGPLTEALIGFIDPYLNRDFESRQSVGAVLKTFVRELDEAMLQSPKAVLHHDQKDEARFKELRRDLEQVIHQEALENRRHTESLIATQLSSVGPDASEASRPDAIGGKPVARPSDLVAQCFLASQGLLKWRRTLGNGVEIERKEYEVISARIHDEPSSSTLLLGSPGSGKSALLAKLGTAFVSEGYAILAIKADMLGASIHTPHDLQEWLKLDVDTRDAVSAIAKQQPVILLIDQLDAVSELLDRNSGRLNVLLDLIHRLAGVRGVHIIASSREFEYRHDIRLASIQAECMELHLPEWEVVSPTLEAAGHAASNFTPVLQDVLRVPLHLKLFLELATPGMEFSSLQALLAELWKQRVLNPIGPRDRSALLKDMAQRMSEDEVLWLPDVFADEHTDALQALLSAEILIRGDDGQTIGFRHQTYYDFTLARAFAQGTIPLARYVLERQDGLFVRPALLSGLQYLRGTAPTEYHRQLDALLRARPRLHVLSLITEFLGGQKEPDEVEAGHLLPMLDSDVEGPRILHFMQGSPGWFVRLQLSGAIASWMAKPPDQAVHCAPVLSAAAKFDMELVLDLLVDSWLKDASYDHLTLGVLTDAESWSDRCIRVMTEIAKRSSLWHMDYLIDRIAETSPKQAAQVLRAHLDRRLGAALAETNRPEPAPSPDASELELALHSLRFERMEPVRRLLDDSHDFYRVEEWAKEEPSAFLDAVWPWFVEASRLLAYENRLDINEYRPDHLVGLFRGEITVSPLLKGIVGAVEALAEQEPDIFLAFSAVNQDLDLMLIHRIIARGYQRLNSSKVPACLEYLLGDPRRLAIGDRSDEHRESRKLIRLMSAILEPDRLLLLERAVLEYKMYLSPPQMASARERLAMIRWNRQARLRLLRAFEPGTLSPSASRLRHEEERALPGTKEVERSITGGWIGPRIGVDQMQKSSDEDLLHLIKTLPDATQWDNPRGDRFANWGQSGGAIQLSRELREFAKKYPERVAVLLPSLPPDTHGMYAGAGLEGIAEAGLDPQRVVPLVMDLHHLGFVSSEFRSGAASAIETCAKNGFRPPDDITKLLEEWLSREPEPREVDDPPEEKPEKRAGSIIFESHQTWGLPHGRGPILRALVASYLAGDSPDIEGWRRLIRSRLSEERHPSMWVNTLIHMPILFRGDAKEATELYDEVLRICPEVLRYHFALHYVAYILRWATPVHVVRDWLIRLSKDGTDFCLQAYGEILFLYHCIHRDEWSAERVKIGLSEGAPTSVRRGIAYGASHLWDEAKCRPEAAEALSSLALDKDEEVCGAVAQVFSIHGHDLSLDTHLRQIITPVLRSTTVLLDAASDLAEIVAPYASYEPDFVSRVVQAILDAGGAQVATPSSELAAAAETLTNISLTLHRLSSHRESGLSMFERLIALNVREAASALDVIDRRPRAGSPGVVSRRRRRRSKRSRQP